MFIWSMFLDQGKAVKLELLRAQYDCLYESPQVTWTKIPNKQSKFQINNQILGSVNIPFICMLPMKELWLQMPA